MWPKDARQRARAPWVHDYCLHALSAWARAGLYLQQQHRDIHLAPFMNCCWKAQRQAARGALGTG